MDAPWVAVYVETSAALSEEEKRRLTKNLSLARQLGAEVVMTTGDDVAGALVEAAREQGVTQMVVGKPTGNPVCRIDQGRLVGEPVDPAGRRHRRPRRERGAAGGKRQPATLVELGGNEPAAGLRGGCGRGGGWRPACRGCCRDCWDTWRCHSFICWVSWSLAMRLNRWAVLLAAALSAVAWDYLFIPPLYTFAIGSPHDLMMFTMFFIVALAMGHTTHNCAPAKPRSVGANTGRRR